jgi:hypothetical protein
VDGIAFGLLASAGGVSQVPVWSGSGRVNPVDPDA